jgi:hypothetical protein
MTDQPVSRPAAAEAQPLPPDVPNPPERLNDVQSLKEDLLERIRSSPGRTTG